MSRTFDADLPDEGTEAEAVSARPRRSRTGKRPGRARSLSIVPEPDGAAADVHESPDSHSITDARARLTGSRFPARRTALIHPGLTVALMSGDLVALALAAAIVRGSAHEVFIFSAFILISRGATQHYRRRLSVSVLDDLPRLIGGTVVAVGLAAVGLALGSGGGRSAFVSLVERAFLYVLLAFAVEFVVAVVIRMVRRRGIGRRTVVVGSGRVGELLAQELVEHAELGLQPVGVIDPRLEGALVGDTGAADLPVLGTDVGRLADTVVQHHIETAILAFEDGEAHVDTVIALHHTGCEMLLVPPLFEMQHDGPDVYRVRGVPLIQLRSDPTTRLSWWVKRAFDIFAAALGLLLLSPLLLVVGILVLIDSGWPVLFWQDRVGLDGQIFRLCKFRSMRPGSELESQTQWNIAHDPRVSRLGRLLRRTSIDEIPQLWNIVRGQMSLVGPRPERPTFVERFTQEHERYWARHRVPVGLTGLAQVNGLRGDTSISDRARFDNYYIANWSLWLDAKVLLRTAREVLGARGR